MYFFVDGSPTLGVELPSELVVPIEMILLFL